MLEKIRMGRFCCAQSTQIENFRPLLGDELIDEILELARELKEVRICQINATPLGGGVAELLSREVPILESMGMSVDWRIIHGDQEFFSITKAFHLTAVIKIIYNKSKESQRRIGGRPRYLRVHQPCWGWKHGSQCVPAGGTGGNSEVHQGGFWPGGIRSLVERNSRGGRKGRGYPHAAGMS